MWSSTDLVYNAATFNGCHPEEFARISSQDIVEPYCFLTALRQTKGGSHDSF
jgi:hypothetical protein